MEQKMFLRSYCLIGLGSVEAIKEDLSVISESSVNYVSGKDMIITTFTTTFKIAELENPKYGYADLLTNVMRLNEK